jgi:hypothetical protein
LSPRGRRLLGLFVLAALLGPLLVDALWTSDEERVEAALDDLERALEERDAERLAARFAEGEVTTAHPIPFLNRRRDVSLLDALRDGMRKLAGLKLDRDRTTVEFPQDGLARVSTAGVGWVDVSEGRFPFHFELEFGLATDSERRFRLASIDNVRIEPGIR